ncbi:hypothetical protein HK104_005325, partial [Borealophlyctis nickersoniae]
CSVPGTVAVTFDDGPYQYTQSLISQFNAAGAKLTLFVNGLNYACIYDNAQTLRDAYNQGHQIGSHTWSHPDLAGLDSTRVRSEMTRLDDALQKIIGAKPRFMRPPYGSYNPSVLSTIVDLGYTTVALWSLDSGDSTGASLDQQKANYQNSDSSIRHVALNHDPNANTVNQMVPFILQWARDRGLRLVTVGECLGMDKSTWYRDVGAQGPRDGSWVC